VENGLNWIIIGTSDGSITCSVLSFGFHLSGYVCVGRKLTEGNLIMIMRKLSCNPFL
jgi:hypothetical protein